MRRDTWSERDEGEGRERVLSAGARSGEHGLEYIAYLGRQVL